jgi:integrase
MRDRYGVWRHYLRRRGFKRVALSGLYGSEEFAESYRLAIGGGLAVAPREIGANRTKPGTLGALIVSYFASKHWTDDLAKNSRSTRRPILEKLRTGPWGPVMVSDLKLKHVRAMIDAESGHQKKHALKAVRGFFRFAIEIELIEEDPSAGLRLRLAPTDGYHSWEAAEIERFRDHWPLGTEPRLTLELALETASRRTEITRIGRQHVKAGRIRVARVKGCNAVDIPISPALQAALDAMPRNEHLTYLVNAKGQPYSAEQLGIKFAEWATEAGLPSRCRLHGLRKARTAQLASKGAAAHLIMAITGHKSLSEVQRYADKFNRREAADAAMALLQSSGAKAAGLTVDDLIEIITRAATEREQKCKTA